MADRNKCGPVVEGREVMRREYERKEQERRVAIAKDFERRGRGAYPMQIDIEMSRIKSGDVPPPPDWKG